MTLLIGGFGFSICFAFESEFGKEVLFGVLFVSMWRWSGKDADGDKDEDKDEIEDFHSQIEITKGFWKNLTESWLFSTS
jgi:hypothetical protein